MKKICTSAALAFSVLLTQQSVGFSSQVSANGSQPLASSPNQFQTKVRLVVYDDMNPNFNRRKVAYSTDLSVGDEKVKALIQGLAPSSANLHCNEKTVIYVLEITEAGHQRKYSSNNNHCNRAAAYTGYMPTEAMAELAQAMSISLAY